MLWLWLLLANIAIVIAVTTVGPVVSRAGGADCCSSSRRPMFLPAFFLERWWVHYCCGCKLQLTIAVVTKTRRDSTTHSLTHSLAQTCITAPLSN